MRAVVLRGLLPGLARHLQLAARLRGMPDGWQERGRDLLDRFILPEFGPRPVHTIDRDDVERWYDRTASDRPTYRAKAYSLLRTILVSAIDDGHHPGPNPARIRGAGQADRRHTVRPATLDELKALTEAMPDVASVKMMRLCEVGMMAPTKAAWVVTLTA